MHLRYSDVLILSSAVPARKGAWGGGFAPSPEITNIMTMQKDRSITSSLSSWRVAFSRSLLPLRSSARTVYPPLAAGPRSLWACDTRVCHGRSGESRWWVTDHRHVSITAMVACHLSPWYIDHLKITLLVLWQCNSDVLFPILDYQYLNGAKISWATGGGGPL